MASAGPAENGAQRAVVQHGLIGLMGDGSCHFIPFPFSWASVPAPARHLGERGGRPHMSA